MPAAASSFVTAHDGFTLWDLFSYHDKHNEANGEDNRDGEPVNHSWNCGHEGPTDDEAANAHWEHAELDLPEPPDGLCWSRFADTSTPAPEDACEPGQERPLTDQTRLPIGPRSVGVLTTKPTEETP